jgi:hypothetical protein
MVLFENLKHAQVGEAAGESTAKSQANSGLRRDGTWLYIAADWDAFIHG